MAGVLGIIDNTAISLIGTFIAGLVAVNAGLYQVERSRRKARLESKKEIDEIAGASAAIAEEARARTLELLVEKLPSGMAVDEFLDNLENTASKLTKTVDVKTKEDPTWQLVEDLVTNYHKQALNQASVQFWFSVTAAVIGFGFILYKVSEAGISSSDAAISAIPGVLIELVAALFFKQAGETRQRATELYDRLRTDNQKREALLLVNSIDNASLRSVVKAQLALKIGGVDSSIQDLKSVLFETSPTGDSEIDTQKTRNKV